MSKLPKPLSELIEKNSGDYAFENSSFRDCSICNNKEHGLEQGYIKGATDLTLAVLSEAEKLVEALESCHIDDSAWDLDNLDEEIAREWHQSNNQTIDKALSDWKKFLGDV